MSMNFHTINMRLTGHLKTRYAAIKFFSLETIVREI